MKINYLLFLLAVVLVVSPVAGILSGDDIPWCEMEDLLLTNITDSNITQYNKLLNYPPIQPQQSFEVKVSQAQGEVYIGGYITEPFPSGIYILPAIFRARTQHYVESASGTTTVIYKVYNYTASGTEIGPLFYETWRSDDINNVGTVPTEYITNYARRNTTKLFPGDRLLIKMYGQTTNVPSTTLGTTFTGNVNVSYITSGYFYCPEYDVDFVPANRVPVSIAIPILCVIASVILLRKRD